MVARIKQLMWRVQRIIDRIRRKPPPPDIGPDPTNPEVGREWFLWKPVSDSNGKLVVLLPSAFAGHTNRMVRLREGQQIVETGSYSGLHNPDPGGPREHYRFPSKGADYPRHVEAEVLVHGWWWSWRIPDPALRYESRIRPTTRRA